MKTTKPPRTRTAAPRAPAPADTAPEGPRDGQRIAKLLARAGIASRREIERMIAEGRIALDGKAIDTPATVLTSLRGITVDGQPVQEAAPARLFLFHKPAGVLTTEYDPKGRPTIYDRLPRELPRVVPVGRLDYNTEGLLLLTTDGELKRQLELPSTGVERSYRARAFGTVSQEQLEELIQGIEVEGIRYGAIDANLERRTGRNQWIEMNLTEGKNREVRRVLEHLGLEVSRLIRTAYGPFVLAGLPVGAVEEVRRHDLIIFRKNLSSGAASALRTGGAARTKMLPTSDDAEAETAQPSDERPTSRPGPARTGPARTGALRTGGERERPTQRRPAPREPERPSGRAAGPRGAATGPRGGTRPTRGDELSTTKPSRPTLSGGGPDSPRGRKDAKPPTERSRRPAAGPRSETVEREDRRPPRSGGRGDARSQIERPQRAGRGQRSDTSEREDKRPPRAPRPARPGEARPQTERPQRPGRSQRSEPGERPDARPPRPSSFGKAAAPGKPRRAPDGASGGGRNAPTRGGVEGGGRPNAPRPPRRGPKS